MRQIADMESTLLRLSNRGAVKSCRDALQRTSHRTAQPINRLSRRCFATPTSDAQPDFQAAPPFAKGGRADRFKGFDNGSSQAVHDEERLRLLDRVRVVPASPSYFSATPHYLDDVLHLSELLRKHQTLPRLPLAQAPKVAWTRLPEYKIEVGEPVRVKAWGVLQQLLKRLNCIHPSVMPSEVLEAMEKYKRQVQPHENQAKPIEVDELGRAVAVGRRKSSSAKVYVVEGNGTCKINGRSVTDYFGRIHDRESALWALKATERMDKYNVWALVRGGGTTGQAEAITLGLARALLAHEPDLKPALRKGEFMHIEPRDITLTILQPVASLAIRGEWRERSLVI